MIVSRQFSSERLDKSHAVVRTDCGRGSEVEGVEYPDGVRLVGQVRDLTAAGPPERGRLAGRGQGAVLAVDHDGGNAHRVPWAVCHRRVTSSATLAPVDHTYRQVEEYSCHQI